MRMSGAAAGFTLLEVMIAVAVLAITLTVLYGSQSQSLSLAAEAKFNTQAAFLLEQKLAELQSGKMDFLDGEGDFEGENSQFSWSVATEDHGISDPEIFTELNDLKRAKVTIFWKESPFSFSVDYYYVVER